MLRGRVGPLATVVSLLLGAPMAQALDPGTPLHALRRQHWRTSDGLPSDTVQALLQDRAGYLWVGTQEGLARFDGLRFTVFDRGAHAPRFEPDVRAMVQRADGSLAMATDGGGVWTWRAETGLRPLGASIDGFVRALVAGPDDSLWLGTRDGLVNLGTTAVPVPSMRAGAANNVKHLAWGPDGALWVGTPNGLSVWREGRLTPFGPEGTQVQALWVDADGTLWVGTRAGGLLRYAGGAWSTFTTTHGLPHDHVSALLRDRDGVLWVGTYGGGLARAQGARFVGGEPGVKVLVLAEDRDGGVWMGGEGSGLARLGLRPLPLLTTADGLAHDQVTVVHASGSAVWAGFSDGRVQHVGAPALPIIEQAPVVSLAEHRGHIWALTKRRLSRWDGQRWHAQPLAADAHDLLLDDEGRPWVAAGGLLRGPALDPVAGAQEVRRLWRGPSGTIWVGLTDGLARLREGALERVADVPSGVTGFAEEGEILWVATGRRGLMRLREGRTQVLSTAHGLPSDRLSGVALDGRGRLWASSSRGIFWATLDDLHAVANGQQRRLRAVVHGGADDIVTPSAPGAGVIAADSEGLWFATWGGLARWTAKSRPEAPPRATIESVEMDGQTLAIGEHLHLPPSRGNLTVAYTAPTFSLAHQLRFRHRLLGVDGDWVDAGTRRSAHYGGLPPGRYRFEVMALGPAGASDVVSLGFTLRPPFHRTWWFFGAVALAVGATIFGFHRLRLARVQAGFRAVLAERARIARDMHDTLAQGFVALSVQIERLRRVMPQAEALPLLDEMKNMVRESLAEARKAVWELRTQALESGDLPSALAALAARVSADPPVTLEVSEGRRPLPQRTERELLFIGQEAIANALRHARARHVMVRLSYAPDSVSLAVSDDGVGVSGTPGQGLRGMRERADAIGGRLSIDSTPKGTTVTIEVRA